MFNIGFAELILVLLIAFLVVGPKDLPRVARWLGRGVKRIRQMVKELKQEVGWEDISGETTAIKQDIEQTVKEADLSADLRSASREFKKSMDDARKSADIKKP